MNQSDTTLLDPPTFDLPSDYYENPSDYEIWSLRTPIKFDISQLDGQTLQIQNLANVNTNENAEKNTKTKKNAKKKKNAKNVNINIQNNGPETILTRFQIENNNNGNGTKNIDQTYNLSLSQPNETQSFRILNQRQKKSNNNDSDDDNNDNDNEKDKEMVPMPISFTRSLNIIETTNANITDLELAPSMDRAANVDFTKEKMRVPYVKIDQKTGLKKRWNMFGSNATFVNSNISSNSSSIDAGTATITPSASKSKRKVSDDAMDATTTATMNSSEKKKKKSKKSKKSKKQ